MGLIYVLQGPDGKRYVGQTCRPLHVRLREHWDAATAQRPTPLHRAIRRHGAWDPRHKTIKGFRVSWFACPDGGLNAAEAQCIRRLNAQAPRGYNVRTHFP